MVRENTFDVKLFKIYLVQKSIPFKELQKALKWSVTTTYNKTHGIRAFTAPEILDCALYLDLTLQDVNKIFFQNKIREDHNDS
jgi:hypothetical protein